MGRHMAQRLIGAPPGYADSEQGRLFDPEAVRRRPRIPCCCSTRSRRRTKTFFNLLLQVLDDGPAHRRPRSARGFFRNTVVIMTSNIGSDRILESDPKLFESEPESRSSCVTCSCSGCVSSSARNSLNRHRRNPALPSADEELTCASSSTFSWAISNACSAIAG